MSKGSVNRKLARMRGSGKKAEVKRIMRIASQLSRKHLIRLKDGTVFTTTERDPMILGRNTRSSNWK